MAYDYCLKAYHSEEVMHIWVVYDVLLGFCHFSMWFSGSGMVLVQQPRGHLLGRG